MSLIEHSLFFHLRELLPLQFSAGARMSTLKGLRRLLSDICIQPYVVMLSTLAKRWGGLSISAWEVTASVPRGGDNPQSCIHCIQ